MKSFFRARWRTCSALPPHTKLPCLQKDFVVDEFQLLQARAHGADAVLLIVAVLSPAELVALSKKSRELGLDVLCEAHSEEELHRALDSGCDLIGVNNRDLRTFKVDVNTALRLAEMIPKNVVSVAESGIDSGADISRLRARGISGVPDRRVSDESGIAGRSAEDSIGRSGTRRLCPQFERLSWSFRELPTGNRELGSMTWIKICGTTNLEDALTAVEAGADALGFVFYEKSPRNIIREVAREIVSRPPEQSKKSVYL